MTMMGVNWLQQSVCPLCSSCAVPLQPIRIQTASGKVETAVLHIFEMQTSAAIPEALVAPATAASSAPSSTSGSDMRVCALHQRSPVQMFMFDSHGALLNANKAALEGLQTGAGKLPCQTFHQLLCQSHGRHLPWEYRPCIADWACS